MIRTQALSSCVALGVAASLIALAAGAFGGAVDDDAEREGWLLPSAREVTVSAGIVLVYANQYTSAVNQTVRQHASVEMQMNYVERCDEYTRVPQEAPATLRARPPRRRSRRAAGARGEIAFERLTLRYAHGVSCGAGGALVAAGGGGGGGDGGGGGGGGGRRARPCGGSR